jgi:colicin import membrane protein
VTARGTPAARQQRPQPGRVSAILLALAVHAAFFALIFFGVSWQSRPTPAVEVELWDKLPKAEPAPEPWKPVEAKPLDPVPDPPKIAELKPPPALEAEEAKPEPPKPDAEIAEKLERKKRELEKRERERLERVEKQKVEEAKKREEEQARKKAEAEQKRREDEKKRREEEQKRREVEAAKKEAEKAAQAAAAARQAEFDKFVNAIKAKIRGRANVPDTVRGNPELHVRIRVLPGGEVLDITITKGSGNPAYDSAIERGIRSASPLPVPPPNSELFPQFRELNLNFRHER